MNTRPSPEKFSPPQLVIRSMVLRLGLALVLTMLATRANAFSLLGPYTEWMLPRISYQQPDDIGGPMDLDEEYRWNVPVVTYGFDRSFLDYFGSNGVAAVEQAIQTLNHLPPASDLVLSNYPLNSQRVNVQAHAQGLSDLKSATLAVLLEQMGLAQPTRNVFDLMPQRIFFPDGSFLWTFSSIVIERNFDPETLSPSHYVNQILYDVYDTSLVVGAKPEALEFLVDPLALPNDAVADRRISPGTFYTGLTQDDIGGLRYLLGATNVNFESVLPHVHLRHPRTKAAWRPGVEKITFVPHRTNRNRKFRAMVLRFVDRYVANDLVKEQSARRPVTRPDILFCAGDTGENSTETLLFRRTSTSNWINNAASNGDPAAAGPGIIRPPVRITFQKLGALVESGDAFDQPQVINRSWSSFDNSPSAPVVYPSAVATGFSVRLRAYDTSYSVGSPTNVIFIQISNTVFHLNIPAGGQAALQISTNQTDWTSLATVINAGAVVEWHYFGRGVDWGSLFFRVIPQPLAPEEHVILIEVERERKKDRVGIPGLPPLPPAPLTPTSPEQPQ